MYFTGLVGTKICSHIRATNLFQRFRQSKLVTPLTGTRERDIFVSAFKSSIKAVVAFPYEAVFEDELLPFDSLVSQSA